MSIKSIEECKGCYFKLTKNVASWGLQTGNILVVLDRQAVKSGAYGGRDTTELAVYKNEAAITEVKRGESLASATDRPL